MKELHDFIPSPRAGKRFINIYRLLRASVKETERDAFLGDSTGGRYQAAMLLLAVLTGYPDQATELLRELLENKPQGAWTAFRAAFEAKLLPGGVGMTGVVPGTLAERALATDKAAWMELFQKLDGIEGHICVRNMEEFLEWAPRVARYSFQSGRVLLSQHD